MVAITIFVGLMVIFVLIRAPQDAEDWDSPHRPRPGDVGKHGNEWVSLYRLWVQDFVARWTILALFALFFAYFGGVAAGAPPKAPPVYVPPKAPPVQPEAGQPAREFWQGYGWVEWRNGSWHRAADQGVSARPFREAPPGPTTPGISVRAVAGASSPSPASTGTGRTITLAPGVGLSGGTNCPPSG